MVFQRKSISVFNLKIDPRSSLANRIAITKRFFICTYRRSMKPVPDFFVKIDQRFQSQNRSAIFIS